MPVHIRTWLLGRCNREVCDFVPFRGRGLTVAQEGSARVANERDLPTLRDLLAENRA